jgi:hypothetical protein
VLHGLHAAHEAKDERGHPLGIVHRDMSPQNVLVGTDGVARVLDFGVAKAAGRMQTTREGQIKGKLSYMPPEQLRGASVNRQSDIYAAGVMLWELVTGQRLFAGDNEGAIVAKVLEGHVEAPSKVLMRSVSGHQTLDDRTMRALESIDSTILRALASEPADRFATAREMAVEIERKLPPATGSEVADWVEVIAKEVLHSRAAMVAEIESSTSHVAAEPREGHVQSVLQAKATLAPSQSNLLPPELAMPATVPQRGEPSSPMLMQTMAMPGGLPVARPSYQGSVEGPPVTQPSSISVASGSFGRQQEFDRPGARRTAVAAILGVMLGASVLASALVYRYTVNRSKVVADGLVAHDAGAVVGPPGSVATAPTTATAIVTRPAPVADVTDAGASPSGEPAVRPPAAQNGIATVTPGTTGGALAGNGSTTAKPPLKQPIKPPAGPTKPATPAATAPATGAAECATPAWFDAQGVKHYKPQCLDK